MGLATLASASVLLLSACDSDSSSSAADGDPAESSTSEATPEEPSEDLPPPNSDVGSPVEPGTYTYDSGPFPVTFTTRETTYDMSNGGDPYRVIAMEDYGLLALDFPVNAADLGQPPSDEVDEYGQYQVAGPIDFPDDVGAWLGEAIALDIADQGTIELTDGEASWWDLEVSDPDARCFEDGDEPCVTLWSFDEEQPERQIGVNVMGSARLYAVDAGDETLMLATEKYGVEDVPAFLDDTDQIVASLTLP